MITMECVQSDMNFTIYRHAETGVYYISRGEELCVMLNADGTPYTGRLK